VDRIEAVLKTIQPPPEESGPEGPGLPAPTGGLGSLGELGDRLRAIYGARAKAGPGGGAAAPLRKMLVIAAADHGVARAGASRYPHSSTADLVRDVLEGRAAVARLASGLQVRTVVADFGTADEPDAAAEGEEWAAFESLRVASGAADITEAPAMPRDTALDCVRAGIDLFKRDSKGWDVDLAGLGDLGLGSTTSACAIAVALTGLPVDQLCGEAGGAVAGRPAARADLVRKAVERVSPDTDDAVGLLAEYGGLEMAALTGVCLAAAADRVPVLLDGVVSTAAGVMAVKLAPATRSYLIASHEAAVAAHGELLGEMGLEPLLRLRLGVGEGAGAVLAMGLVEAAWTLARASGAPES
jgi:nicotinate-nucleotide--dimethylbenzimidazole phosphoribosyltransferase